MGDIEQKGRIMENLYLLGETSKKFQDLSVRHDLTHTQRAELKQKIDNAKRESDQSEDFLYLVRTKRGPNWEVKVIKVKKTERGERSTRPHAYTES
jgi:hypothetical protein